MSTYIAGTAIRFDVEIRDKDNILIDPTSINITVAIGNTIKVNSVGMTKDVTGKYYYNWQSNTADDAGYYDVRVVAVYNSLTSIKEAENAFNLKD